MFWLITDFYMTAVNYFKPTNLDCLSSPHADTLLRTGTSFLLS